MNLRWCYFFIASIFALFSCNQQPSSNKAQRDRLRNQQTLPKDTTISKNITTNDTGVINDLYNKLSTTTLPFLPSNQTLSAKIASRTPSLPYTSVEDKNLVHIKKQTRLIPVDSAFVIGGLKTSRPQIVNPDGGTSFGDFDCLLDSANCLNTDEYGKIGIVCALKVDTNYLCHIMLTHKDWYYNDRGILALITPQGKILDWVFSDGELTQGNPHGNIIRTLTINSDHSVKIEEYSVGDNSEHYEFTAIYSVSNSNFILKKRKLHMLNR
ncbi:hypothetical protein SNE25_15955 [Mucilaginibacter sabulilitoris]|uniref:Lipoprotein n=1 Tax=Mucilaginibacter sabulilitoris TaxID=1173583 RepID=A0ABZ0TV97_9SPHI|nr:hypothetical protein [Mucilaginibacter sabulilitoris]WPU97016.1 hypothetical protein SNE25_15955 [Mucilaginibacter sabulilitoris]